MARGDRQAAQKGGQPARRGGRSAGGDEVSITLSAHQVEHVVRSASSEQGGLVHTLLLTALDHAHRPASDGGPGRESLRTAARRALDTALEDPQLSQSLLRGLAILSCYSQEREWRSITELARELGMPPSTTHRYARTLRAIGLLEQDPATRGYRPVALPA